MKSLTAMNKKKKEELGEGDKMECRPVAKGNVLLKAATKTLLEPFKQSLIAVTKPTQFGLMN